RASLTQADRWWPSRPRMPRSPTSLASAVTLPPSAPGKRTGGSTPETPFLAEATRLADSSCSGSPRAASASVMPLPSHRLLLAALLTAAACAQTPPSADIRPQSASAPTASADATSAGGVDLAAMDPSARPGDDFYAYANGKWLSTTEIPADRTMWGASGELDERVKTQTREILEAAASANAAPGSLERKVGDFYASAMDEATVESKGLAPLKPALSRIAKVKNRADLATYLGEELRADVDAMDCTSFQTSRFVGLWVAPDLNAPARSVPCLMQGGLGLPDREYYLSTAPRMVETRTKYR